MPESDQLARAHAVIVLAAGGSSRLGQPKQLLVHCGETLVRRAARLALSTGPSDAVIVIGAHAKSIFAEVQNLPLRRIDCADWRSGMSASLRTGLGALAADCAGALIMACDQLTLTSAHLDALCAAWRTQPQRTVASHYAGRLGIPALLPRSWFKELQQQAAGDHGARSLLAAKRDEVSAIANESLAFDIDRPEDLALLT